MAEPLYGFYNTEISLHFLHALVSCPVYVRTLQDIFGEIFLRRRFFFSLGFRKHDVLS